MASPGGGTMWPRAPHGIAFGGDYNPEQWASEVWKEDVRLMGEAGVDLVTVGVFAWALLEPAEGRYEFGWLDEVMDLLHTHGVHVDLATATASPPPWFSRTHPDSLPVTADGRRLWPGGRQAYCPSSPEYRERSVALAQALATRYGDHPALVMWHVNNEYGCHVTRCYCDTSAEAFRRWLQRRYGDLEALNHAWGTSFWSQRYYSWDEVLPPRIAPAHLNPTQQLDFARFSSDELLDCYRAERDVLHRLTPGIPVTTNFMVAGFKELDYWSWAREMDLVSNDHYLAADDPQNHVDLAFSADLTRSLAGGRPWLLMEHSTSGVNWQPRNVAKRPGEMRRNSVQHAGRGADGIMFFQWRASRAGAEKYHSALVPHAGTETKVWREVVELGRTLEALSEVRGSVVESSTAILWDWNAWWASELDSHPSVDVSYPDLARRMYQPLWELGVGVDFAHPEADLSGYRLVLVPGLYLVDDAAVQNLRHFVRGGGTVVVTYWSGIVDEHDHVRLGGYPGAFRDLLGIRTEEFFPLLEGQKVRLDDGSTGDLWTEWVHLDGAEAETSYADGPLPGVPAVTRHTYGEGTAWYVATRPDPAAMRRLLERACRAAGVDPAAQTRAGVEVVRRRGEDTSYLFLVNHTDEAAEVTTSGTNLLTGEPVEGVTAVPAGDVVVIREGTS
ncbi:MAG: beta-galactosidase [Microthrixaceae bacterium]